MAAPGRWWRVLHVPSWTKSPKSPKVWDANRGPAVRRRGEIRLFVASAWYRMAQSHRTRRMRLEGDGAEIGFAPPESSIVDVRQGVHGVSRGCRHGGVTLEYP